MPMRVSLAFSCVTCKMAADHRDTVLKGIEKQVDLLRTVSEDIWKFAELGYEEHRSSKALATALETVGFNVERNAAGLSTAFRATYGSGSPNVAFLCEFDALPEIGHACGHNLIAEAGLAAGIGLKSALERFSLPGTVTVLGTPAEEGGAGKVVMIDAGYFNDVDFAMMVHPAYVNDAYPQALAVRRVAVTFHGKEAHAAMAPWEGVNALDAAVMAYNSISVMRQQMKPSWRIHAVISNGGTKPNIIPGKTEMEYYIRAPTEKEVEDLQEKSFNCFRAAATATGCTVDIKETGKPYSNLVTNKAMADLFIKECTSLGCEMSGASLPTGSTDMGNVSYVVPSIHPMYAIGTAVNHSAEFTAVANSGEAHTLTVSMGKAMALTALEVLSDSSLLEQIKKEFKQQVKIATGGE